MSVALVWGREFRSCAAADGVSLPLHFCNANGHFAKRKEEINRRTKEMNLHKENRSGKRSEEERNQYKNEQFKKKTDRGKNTPKTHAHK
jgi:hypothetical protein